MKKIFVTGTDTDVGKTIVSAGLCLSWPAHYWKPIQCGTDPYTDSEVISRFIPKEHIHPSSYQLKAPLSPNQSARKENITINKNHIKIPPLPPSVHLVIEGAGGLLVPINGTGETILDLIKWLKASVIIIARSTLGTLNHSFLTLSALKQKNIEVLGFVLVGPPHPLNKQDIENLGGKPVLVELPFLKTLTKETLKPHFQNIKFFLPE